MTEDTSSQDIDEIRADLEEIRARLAQDVSELEQKADPERVRREATARVKDEARGQARRVRDTAMGNPLGAGLLAFGAGMVMASLIPASDDEERIAVRLRARFEEPAKEQAKEAAQAIREDVEPQARQSTQRVQRQAEKGARRTKDDAQSRSQAVQKKARDAQPSQRSSR